MYKTSTNIPCFCFTPAPYNFMIEQGTGNYTLAPNLPVFIFKPIHPLRAADDPLCNETIRLNW